MPELKLISINKSFGGIKILANVTIDTTDGELLVILGPSGCGKSTILRMVAGLEYPDKGEIYIGEKRIDNLPAQKRNCALVFQNYALYPHMTVAKNLGFPLTVSKIPKAEIKKRVLGTAELIGLADRLKAYPSELSGGQRQRVALGRAIIRKPDIFLLDEPLSNLDADLRARMRKEIVKLVKKLGVTTVHVTHDQTEALTMADRIAILDSGVIRQIGTVDEIYNSPADIFTASFVGSPRMNIIKGWASNSLIKPVNLSTMIIAPEYSLREFVIGIRPEDITIDNRGSFSGIVEATEYLGDHCLVTVRYLEESITINTDIDQYAVGDELRFDINSERVQIFDKESGRSLRR
jgi:ABC-type sugar transport system ATPase subunit